jgi:hypothetical protein
MSIGPVKIGVIASAPLLIGMAAIRHKVHEISGIQSAQLTSWHAKVMPYGARQ